jgi:hypothetical protein
MMVRNITGNVARNVEGGNCEFKVKSANSAVPRSQNNPVAPGKRIAALPFLMWLCHRATLFKFQR